MDVPERRRPPKDKEWQPKMDAATRGRLYKQWLEAVTRSFDWVE